MFCFADSFFKVLFFTVKRRSKSLIVAYCSRQNIGHCSVGNTVSRKVGKVTPAGGKIGEGRRYSSRVE